MDEREKMIRLWFAMWLQKRDRGIEEIFAPQAVYIESWGPEYHGVAKIKLWFAEWNARGSVLKWKIKQFFHKENQTAVEWHFENAMQDGTADTFDGISLVQWTNDDKIERLQEFGCNLNRYDPYENGETPQFKEEKALWF